MMQSARKWLIRGTVVALMIAAVVLLFLNIGRFPGLLHTTFFQVVATIVGINTLVYALLGSRKVSAVPARSRRPATEPHSEAQ